MNPIDRRGFLGLAAATAAAGCASDKCGSAGAPATGRILFGACRGLADVPAMKRLGYDFFESGVRDMLQPQKSDAEWAPVCDAVAAAPLPLRSCNGFLPGTFRLTGPAARFEEALAYAETACRRADRLGVKTIVFGSGGARNVPGDFLAADPSGRPNLEKGVEQFTEFCRRLCARIADCQVTVVIEPLRPNESNIINYVWQGLQIVEEVDSPRLRQLADIFHMMCGRESPQSLVAAGSRLLHCHIAARTTRAFPGSNDTDFKPYFNALKSIGYTGGVSCECSWGDKKDREKNLACALETMRRAAEQA